MFYNVFTITSDLLNFRICVYWASISGQCDASIMKDLHSFWDFRDLVLRLSKITKNKNVYDKSWVGWLVVGVLCPDNI